jgi:hypothetical protein
LGLNATKTSLVAISGPKKVSVFRAHPFQWPPSESLSPAPYKQQVLYINNSYIFLFQETAEIVEMQTNLSLTELVQTIASLPDLASAPSSQRITA